MRICWWIGFSFWDFGSQCSWNCWLYLTLAVIWIFKTSGLDIFFFKFEAVNYFLVNSNVSWLSLPDRTMGLLSVHDPVRNSSSNLIFFGCLLHLILWYHFFRVPLRLAVNCLGPVEIDKVVGASLKTFLITFLTFDQFFCLTLQTIVVHLSFHLRVSLRVAA